MTSDSGRYSLFQADDVVADRYLIRNKLGSGGMGTIYEAYDQVMKRPVAFKTVFLSGLKQDDLLRFQREARIASNISNQNIVRMLDFGLLDSRMPFIVMEFMEGRSLEEIVGEEGPLPVDLVLEILDQICEGMAAVHRENIVHRDLKSGNIMLLEDESGVPQVKILDFGIAKSLSGGGSGHETTAGKLFGSPIYMSPEHARGESLDCRADIYSLGCIAFELLTGRHLFTGDSSLEVLHKQINDRPPLVSEFRVDGSITPEIDFLVEKAVLKQPSDRFQTMSEFQNSIRELTDATLILDVVREPEPPKKEPNIYLYVGVISLLLAFTGLAATHLVKHFLIGEQTNSAGRTTSLSEPMTATTLDLMNRPELMDSSGIFISSSVDVKPELERRLAGKKPLDVIYVRRAHLTDEDAKLIFDLSPKYLFIGGAKFSHEGLETISKNERMAYIELDTSSVSVDDIEVLAKNSHIRGISLSGCDITNGALRVLGRSSTLEQIFLKNNPRVTVDGLRFLSNSEIERLVAVFGTPIASMPESEIKSLEKTLNLDLSLDENVQNTYSINAIDKIM